LAPVREKVIVAEKGVFDLFKILTKEQRKANTNKKNIPRIEHQIESA